MCLLCWCHTFRLWLFLLEKGTLRTTATMKTFYDILHGAVQADTGHCMLGAAILGLAFHQAIRNIDFEQVQFKFLAASALSFVALPYIFAHADLGGLSLTKALAKSFLLETAFCTSLLCSIGAYRLAFHRCRKFPGPLASKITRWHSFFLHAKNGQYHKELARLHSQFGDFVRTGTNLSASYLIFLFLFYSDRRCSSRFRSARDHRLPSVRCQCSISARITMPQVGSV